jgi:hypothetical protein
MGKTLERSDYRVLFVESFLDRSRGRVRVRPLPGQWADITLLVECSRSMRKRGPAGTVFRIEAILKCREGVPHVYAPSHWDYEEVTRADAEAAIRREST